LITPAADELAITLLSFSLLLPHYYMRGHYYALRRYAIADDMPPFFQMPPGFSLLH